MNFLRCLGEKMPACGNSGCPRLRHCVWKRDTLFGRPSHRKRPVGLTFKIRRSEMETRRIFISLRGLGFRGGADFCGDGRDKQRCHGQERNRCFI